ncbi:MAG: hypothetical protein LIO87_08685 [Eubacterium sp.]|nr:hypothetical protein [Eubacterium sp.]
MNNKFKRAISSILAFTMVISTLTVMNVTTAFAGTISTESTVTLTGNASTFSTNWASPSNVTTSQASDSITYTYSSASASSTTVYTGLTFTSIDTSSWKFDDTSDSIVFTTDGSFDITIGDSGTSKNVSGLGLYAYNETEGTYSTTSETLTVASTNRVAEGSGISAGKYKIALSSSTTGYYAVKLVIKVYATETVSYESGTLQYSASEGGSISVTGSDGSEIESSDSNELDGGTSYTVTVTPDSGYTISSFTVNSTETALSSNNTYSGIINGNCTIYAEFVESAEITPITESITVGSDKLTKDYVGAEGSIIQTSTSNPSASTTYYFIYDKNDYGTLNSTTLPRVSGVSNSGNCIKFETGDLSGKKATITVDFATGSAGDPRSITVIDSDGTDILTTADSLGTALVPSDEGILSSNTTYYIGSTGSNVYVGGITITVEDININNNVVTIGDDEAYLIAGLAKDSDISKADYAYLAKGDDAVGLADGSPASSIGTVYESVQIYEKTYTADELGYLYIYGFEVAISDDFSASDVADAGYKLLLGTNDTGSETE